MKVMKEFGKILIGLVVGIIAVPLLIITFSALVGFGAILVAIPEIMIGLIVILVVISIPGLIVGLVIGRKQK